LFRNASTASSSLSAIWSFVTTLEHKSGCPDGVNDSMSGGTFADQILKRVEFSFKVLCKSSDLADRRSHCRT